MKNKIKIAIIICVVLLLILSVVLIINIQGDKDKKHSVLTNELNNIIERTPIATSRKMTKYIDLLRDKYYMRYTTKTQDENGNLVDMNIEFAISGDKLYMNYTDSFTTILITKEASYYILHDSKIIQKYQVDSESQKQYYGMQRNYTQAYFEQNFTGTGEEEINGVEYYYEEYKSSDSKIRYYFDENDQLRYIKNISTSGNELSEILSFGELEDESIFELPERYTEYDMTNMVNISQYGY